MGVSGWIGLRLEGIHRPPIPIVKRCFCPDERHPPWGVRAVAGQVAPASALPTTHSRARRLKGRAHVGGVRIEDGNKGIWEGRGGGAGRSRQRSRQHEVAGTRGKPPPPPRAPAPEKFYNCTAKWCWDAQRRRLPLHLVLGCMFLGPSAPSLGYRSGCKTTVAEGACSHGVGGGGVE